MPSRTWVLAIALGGFLTVSVWVDLALAQEKKVVGQNPGQHAEFNQAPAVTRPDFDGAFWISQKGKPESYRAICEKPQNRGDANLCQQWKMAKAAEKQADLTQILLVLTIIEIIALVAVLGLNVYALVIGRQATKAAVEANEIARRTAKQELRAYIGVERAEISAVDKGASPNIIVTIKNFGQTPARDIQHILCRYPMAPNDEDFEIVFDRLGVDKSKYPDREMDIAPRQSVHPRTVISRFEWALWHEALSTGETTLYVWGEVRYKDVFGCPRVTLYRLHLVRDDDGIAKGPLGVCFEGNYTR